jgi:hypothetical protein
MAKSLRASSKVKARNARRFGDNTDYAVAQAARLHSISQRLKERTKGPTVTEQENEKEGDNEGKRQDGEVVEEDELQGWYACFEEEEEEDDDVDDEGVGIFIWEEGEECGGSSGVGRQGLNLELLGLVDPETIRIPVESDELSEVASVLEASPAEWMFC